MVKKNIGSLEQPPFNRVLLTGATGFIGSHLLRKLTEMEIEVNAVSRFKQNSDMDNLIWWRADLRDRDDVNALITRIRPDIIFHLASHVSGLRDRDIVIPTFYDNLASTVHLMTAASKVGCRRFITTGSMEEPQPNDLTGIPGSPYAAAKWAASIYGRMFHCLYEFPVVLLRVFMVYGPGQKDHSKLIPYVIRSFLNGDTPDITSGERKIDWIFVQDAIEGIIAASRAEKIEGCTLDIGSGTLFSIRTVVEKLNALIKPDVKPNFGKLPDRPMEQTRTADVEKTFSLTGWKPSISLEEGLKVTVAFFSDTP